MTRTEDMFPVSGFGEVTAIVMMSDSGDLASEFDSGSVILSFSGGLNCVVHMKKMRSRNATSTIGVMSMLMPIRRFFLSIVRVPYLGSPDEAESSCTASYDASSIM